MHHCKQPRGNGSAADTESAAPGQRSEACRPLSEADHEILGFEQRRWKYPGAKEEAVRVRFGESMTRYYQRLYALVEHPEAEVQYPALVRRLRRLRDARQAARRPGRPATP